MAKGAAKPTEAGTPDRGSKDDDAPRRTRIAENRKARHEFFIVETYEAGIALEGPEVKALRAHRAALSDAYAGARGPEMWLYQCYISPLDESDPRNPDPKRPRKLLLHRHELEQLIAAIAQKGMTVVPLSLYFNARGIAKIELALARGKELHDKRASIAERDARREMDRALRARQKGVR